MWGARTECSHPLGGLFTGLQWGNMTMNENQALHWLGKTSLVRQKGVGEKRGRESWWWKRGDGSSNDGEEEQAMLLGHAG